MYGTGIGTGAAASGMLGVSIATGNLALVVTLIVLLAIMGAVLLRNSLRTAPNQRP